MEHAIACMTGKVPLLVCYKYAKWGMKVQGQRNQQLKAQILTKAKKYVNEPVTKVCIDSASTHQKYLLNDISDTYTNLWYTRYQHNLAFKFVISFGHH